MSQIVGTQAVMNVITGKKYGMLTKEFENYVRGDYGMPPGEISRELLERVPKMEAPKLPTMDSIPKDARAFFRKDEDAVTYMMFPQLALSFLKGEVRLVNENGGENRKNVKWFKVNIGGEELEVKIEGEE